MKVRILLAWLGWLVVAPAGAAGGEPQFGQVLGPRTWSFPRDHGRHDGFKTEWWYFTGHLRDASGRRFGYQFTIFRSVLTTRPATRPSGFAATDLYILHVALSGFAGKQFLKAARLQRGRAG